jgi:hypothetical protein
MGLLLNDFNKDFKFRKKSSKKIYEFVKSKFPTENNIGLIRSDVYQCSICIQGARILMFRDVVGVSIRKCMTLRDYEKL